MLYEEQAKLFLKENEDLVLILIMLEDALWANLKGANLSDTES